MAKLKLRLSRSASLITSKRLKVSSGFETSRLLLPAPSTALTDATPFIY